MCIRDRDIRYAYGFSVTDRAVTEEYLYYYSDGRKVLIFERKNAKDFRFTVDIDEQNTLKERTSANKLYLSVASNWSYAKVIPVLEWFASCQIITKNSVADAYRLEAEQLKDCLLYTSSFQLCTQKQSVGTSGWYLLRHEHKKCWSKANFTPTWYG